MVLAPIVRGRKGEYGKQLEELRADGFSARQGRRRAAQARRADRARQEVQARHRGGRRPARDEGRAAQAAGGLDRDRGRAGRRAGRDRARRHERDSDVLGEVRLPCSRPEPGRARAADLQLQLAPRRLHALHGARVADGDRPGARRPRSDAVDRRGRDRAVVGQRVRLLRPVGAGDRRALRGRSRDAVAGPSGRRARLLPVRHQRRPCAGLLPQPLRPPALVCDPVRGDRAEPRASLPGDRLGLLAREDRGVHDTAAVPGVQGRAPAAGVTGGAGRRYGDS